MRVYDENKMFTYLRGFCKGAGMQSSLKALGYMRERHGSQKRADGQLYIVHPLWMACYAAALGITDDDVISVILLHDVCEDTGVNPESLPFSENIRRGVKYVTFTKYDGGGKTDGENTLLQRAFREPRSINLQGARQVHESFDNGRRFERGSYHQEHQRD